MSNTTSLLGESFRNALQEAAELDQNGVIPEDPDNLFADGKLTHVEIVQACLDFYNEHQSVMDTAIQKFNDYLGTSEGAAYAKALQGSLESPDSELSTQLASEIAYATELGGRAQSLVGFGIGGSAGASLFVGVTVGGDIVFDFQDKAQVIPRKWIAGTVKTGLSANAGFELSFWVDTPFTGVIAGWLIDVYTPPPIPIFYRFLYIKQREEGSTKYTFSGVSIQFPLGLGLPLRRKKEKHPGLLAGFAGKQTAAARSKRATLTVINADTGLTTIAVEENTSLTVTVKNTSGSAVSLSAGATMKIDLPSYFSSTDVSAMNIDYSGWTLANDGSSLTLTLSSNYNWSSGGTLSFNITNVESSNTPAHGQQSDAGTVRVTLSDTSFSVPIVLGTSFDLVWSNSAATLDWNISLSGFTVMDGYSSSGTDVPAYADPGSDIVTLTMVSDNSSGDEWILGYVYNYNTVDGVVPQIYAAWWKNESVKVTNKTVFYGQPVSTSGSDTIAYYTGISSNPNYIKITPTFGS